MKRIGLLSATVVAGMLVTAGPALATEAGVASAGAANFKKGDNAPVVITTLAPCSVEGEETASSPAVTKTGIKFGMTTSTCTTTVVNPDEEITTTRSEARGTGFELSALVALGGPRLKVGSWRITCDATQTGTNAGWALGSMTGWTGLPQHIPANYVHEIKKSNGTVLAKAKFAEVIIPDPNDGSVTMNLIRITFEPASGYSGTISLGSAACSPTP
ncbi:hypothetical protein Lesp02_33260 [Lentzea sp. NBRC 105346]|uniref:hypothetical protein n=1 Tax=Lentzea sp. NBRC 105346 TaxID=3032205 RepID=UPI0024A26CF6|nr:hypothetical protein [Lentzea sp. NBRC 105346]GLZ31138.1 hypothetical protein Lesp02_33260 [Lentzea sp. NBRC 105346]